MGGKLATVCVWKDGFMETSTKIFVSWWTRWVKRAPIFCLSLHLQSYTMNRSGRKPLGRGLHQTHIGKPMNLDSSGEPDVSRCTLHLATTHMYDFLDFILLRLVFHVWPSTTSLFKELNDRQRHKHITRTVKQLAQEIGKNIWNHLCQLSIT